MLHFNSDKDCGSFVWDLNKVAANINSMVLTSLRQQKHSKIVTEKFL